MALNRPAQAATVLSLVAASLAFVPLVSPASAAPVSPCVTAYAVTTCTYDLTGEHQFTVPAGVTSLSVAAYGGRGGGEGGDGGRGARVGSRLAVSPGDVLWVEVAGNGQAFAAGANGGAASVGGYGGGGASDVRTLRASEPGSLSSRLLVAAGGGGSGGNSFGCGASNFLSGGGGDAGTDGADGQTITSPCAFTAAGGKGGKAGSATGGGAGGAGDASSDAGGDGTLGTGGAASLGGGGGGGGLYGGGGGGGGGYTSGGGGGGSNLVPEGGSSALTSESPKVVVTYTGACVETDGGASTTCSWGIAGSYDFSVPDDVDRVEVTAVGGHGAGGPNDAGNFDSPGGRGAVVTGDVDVEPGSTLRVRVGGNGGEYLGGFNGGGRGAYGGGGASDVRTVPAGEDGTLESRLIVAGGGGGAGFQSYDCDNGDGGDAGQDGGDGVASGFCVAGTGGKAGGDTAGGAGGDGAASGTFGDGASSGTYNGSGGGGWYGGGAGGYKFATGGGGGGSNLVPTGGTVGLDDDAHPMISVKIIHPTAPGVSYEITNGTLTNGWWHPTTAGTSVRLDWTVASDFPVTSSTGCDDQELADQLATTYACTASTAGGTTGLTTDWIKVDGTAPTVQAPTLSPAVPLYGGSVTVTANATDATSGVATASCGSLSTAVAGKVSLSCSATDDAGNSATTSFDVVVQFVLSALQSPAPTSKWKAGSTVPIKFKVLDAGGRPIPDALASSIVSRVRWAVSGVQTASGPTTYNASTDTFQGNWKVGKPTGAATVSGVVGYAGTTVTTTRSSSITITK